MANRYEELTPAQKVLIDRRINALAESADSEATNELFDLAWRAKDDLMRVAKELGDRDRLMEESEEDR